MTGQFSHWTRHDIAPASEVETWNEMTDRHAMEKAEAIKRLADHRLTQTEAARVLGMNLSHLNGFIRRNEIAWPIIRQGRKSRWASLKGNGVKT